ncbi:50S ribosomal protein L21 [Candidatus Dojkabacteria bacterium]|uniref:Large ribosomal subunit protein bL21 n=1 Tax=Candidatus Dojkabacteria bacterium TaxID=2099670 RepID=A0A955LB52_9BACT|nr:50S ribosomal protein L21 [Candidatus Dojkabacteria bacterium]
MKYAIIKIGPFQYTVEEGKEYSVPKFEAEAGKKFDSAEVLMVADDKSTSFGKPTVAGAKVTLNILEQAKGEKVTSKIYKAKSRYRKTRGHRKEVTKFVVDKISSK